MKRSPRNLGKKDGIRILIVLACFFFFYLFVFTSTPPTYEHEPIEKYDLTDANVFQTIPFFKKGTYIRAADDVTLVTQVSLDRLQRLQSMAETWGGPISASVYVKHEKYLSKIDAFRNRSRSVEKLVDFHVLFANKTRYPVNNLRNLAIDNSRTDLILVLDADFVTSGKMHSYLSSFAALLKANDNLAYVVPAFSSNLPAGYLPKSKQDLLRAIKRNDVDLVNTGPCPKCHKPTNYAKWQTATEPYKVEYKWIYEPYLVINKATLKEKFDERLKGYGFDKNTHTYALAVAGYTFEVLPDAFVIHLNHEVADWDGPSIQDQLWDALKYVCDILPAVKTKYGYFPNSPLFDEPVGNDACFSRDHW